MSRHKIVQELNVEADDCIGAFATTHRTNVAKGTRICSLATTRLKYRKTNSIRKGIKERRERGRERCFRSCTPVPFPRPNGGPSLPLVLVVLFPCCQINLPRMTALFSMYAALAGQKTPVRADMLRLRSVQRHFYCLLLIAQQQRPLLPRPGESP